jgi:hypothetical protein
MSGFATLLYKEVLRFWKVSFQTVAAPVLSTLLYLLVFAHALSGHVQAFPGRDLRRVPGSRARDDGDAAERLREQLLVAHPVEDHRATSSSSCCRRSRRPRSSSPT